MKRVALKIATTMIKPMASIEKAGLRIQDAAKSPTAFASSSRTIEAMRRNKLFALRTTLG
jgi:hypothetical protein